MSILWLIREYGQGDPRYAGLRPDAAVWVCLKAQTRRTSKMDFDQSRFPVYVTGLGECVACDGSRIHVGGCQWLIAAGYRMR